ncbi:hypothetical protein F5Y19DRAFT_465074 [Xylariaceae sp. FL1651]|nr:hypothetical protein F5Y19DRAFT_465074 [Xylariaceae sp. FL1651]
MFACVLAWMLTAAIVGLVNAGNSRPRSDGMVKCDPIEKYTTEWFLAHTKREYRGVSLCSSALFYSRDMSGAARALAEDQGKVTIWDVWPCDLYEYDTRSSNRMRCIHGSDEQRQFFFGNMSLAFAQKACEGATVLHSSQDYLAPPHDGIWATIELPELTRHGGTVDWLQKIRMHSGWPARSTRTRPAAAASRPTHRSEAEEAWLSSNAGIEWFKSLRVQKEIAAWSEIFWRRLEPARERFNKWEHGDLKKRNTGDEFFLEDNEEGDQDTACMPRERLSFFDDIVSW